jgi:hypothetical protein
MDPLNSAFLTGGATRSYVRTLQPRAGVAEASGVERGLITSWKMGFWVFRVLA